ncbi:YciI family protein [Mesorhizobium sp. 1M-11]|uniref:YciI family protein n=1 Tax=Mesorhizobium sp. 1M-11 TaxID=1529006 RepID=UPI0006C75750|nr:YciI family protein [Mesorhizobium sp. 1M-11]
MLFLVLIYHHDAKMAAATAAEHEALGRDYGAFNKFLAESGALRGTATWPAGVATIRSQDGEALVTEGPYSEAKDKVAGFFLIEVEDMDAAIGFAKRVPGAQYGGVEIRPVQV